MNWLSDLAYTISHSHALKINGRRKSNKWFMIFFFFAWEELFPNLSSMIAFILAIGKKVHDKYYYSCLIFITHSGYLSNKRGSLNTHTQNFSCRYFRHSFLLLHSSLWRNVKLGREFKEFQRLSNITSLTYLHYLRKPFSPSFFQPAFLGWKRNIFIHDILFLKITACVHIFRQNLSNSWPIGFDSLWI